MNKKLLKAKSEWIKFMCEYYFYEKDNNFMPDKNEREENFLYHVNNALKLNEKDFIECIMSEGFMPDAYLEILEVNPDAYLKEILEVNNG